MKTRFSILLIVALALIVMLASVACSGRVQPTVPPPTQPPASPQPTQPPVGPQPTQPPSGQTVVTAQPTIKITWPSTGARVLLGKQFQVHAVARDARGISSIGFAVDGQPGKPVTAAPPQTTFSTAIPVTLKTKGVHTIAVQGNSTTGAKSEPAAIKVVAVQSLSEPPAAGDPPPPTPEVPSGPPPSPPADQPPPPPPPSGASVNFVANPTSIQQGECSTLRWDVEGVSAVYFEGAGVTGHEQREMCSAQTITYTLHVVFHDGSERDYTAAVTVSGAGGGPSGQTPAAPSNLRVTSTTKTTARLAWNDNSNNEDGFEIGIEGMQNLSANANATQFEATGLTCNRAYNLRVRAINAAGSSAWSNQVTAQTAACDGGATAPAAPSNLRVTSTTKTTARLAWNDNSNNEDGFEINIPGMQNVRTARNETQQEISGLGCGRAYNFKVRAFNAQGNSGWSNEVTAQTAACDAGGFMVTSVTVGVDSVTGTCPRSLAPWVVMTVNGPGTVTYRVEYSTGGGSQTRSYNFSAAGSKTWRDDAAALRVEQSGNYQLRLRVLSPNPMTSDSAIVTVTCTGQAGPTPTRTPTPVGKPDLIVRNLRLNPSTVTHGAHELVVDFDVVNQGNAQAGASKARWHTAGDGMSFTCNVPALAPGASHHCSWTFLNVPLDYPKTYGTRAVADSENAVAESNEDNNQSESAPLKVQ